jgi:hypothetical protein
VSLTPDPRGLQPRPWKRYRNLLRRRQRRSLCLCRGRCVGMLSLSFTLIGFLLASVRRPRVMPRRSRKNVKLRLGNAIPLTEVVLLPLLHCFYYPLPCAWSSCYFGMFALMLLSTVVMFICTFSLLLTVNVASLLNPYASGRCRRGI